MKYGKALLVVVSTSLLVISEYFSKFFFYYIPCSFDGAASEFLELSNSTLHLRQPPGLTCCSAIRAEEKKLKGGPFSKKLAANM